MKNLKLLLIILLFPVVLYSQDLIGNAEFGIQNHTGNNIEIQMYPISGCFNGNNMYTFISAHPSLEPVSPSYYLYNYINGTCYQKNVNGNRQLHLKNIVPAEYPEAYFGWNYDWGSNPCYYANINYGNYKLIIKNLETERIDSCLINLDYYTQSNTPGDLYFFIYPNGSQNRFYYRFDRQDQTNGDVEINYNSPDGYTAKSWQPNGPNNTTNAREKDYGNFELVEVLSYNNVDYFPLDSRQHCYLISPQQGFNFPQNQVYPDEGFDERHGILPLNLTIKKKVSTPNSQTAGCTENLQIIIEPSVVLTIDKGITTDNSYPLAYGFYMNEYSNIPHNGNNLVLKSSVNTPITTLKLNSGNNINYNSRIYVHNNCKIIAENNTKIDLGEYSQIFLERLASQSSQIKPKLLLENNSNIVFGANSEINVNAYGEFVNEGGLISYNQNSNAKIIIQSNGLYEIKPNVTNTHTVNNGGRVLLQGGQLKIGDNSKLVFDGSTSYMQVDAGSSILLGANASIEFKNGAFLAQNGGTISSISSSSPGKGLYFENAGAQTSINGVTFSNLTNSIYINNTSTTYANSFKSITNNVFSFSGNESPCYAIETKNAYNITISGNQITLQPNKGIGMLIRYSLISEEESQSTPSYTVNIQNNQIYNGVISAAFTGMASSYAGINFMYNTCSGSASNSSLFMRQTTGNFKNNYISSGSGISLDLNQSTPNVLSNYMSGSFINLHNFASYPSLAPTPDNTLNSGWIWLAGRNTIISSGNGNINYDDGNVLLDWGQNCFTKNSSYHHLSGQINEPSLSYLLRNNDFNGSNEPDSYLFDISSGLEVVPYFAGSNFSCSNSTDAGSIWLIRNLGNGVFDTLYKSANNSGTQPSQDEVLFNTATQKQALDDYTSAVSYFKSLITGFPSSSYTDASLYKLYDSYQKLDVSNDPGIRDILYTDLKNFLDGKILSGLYSNDFNNSAYNITMMCLSSIENYNDAMTGYEFIALYHPDAYTRLLASWDYAEVEILVNGSGGISSKEENLTDAEYYAKLSKRVSKGINEDPIKKKMKKSFDKVKTEKTAKLEKETLTKTKDEKSAKLEVAKMKQKDEMMNTKVTSVMRYSKTLKKEVREKMQIEDILFSRKTENKEDVKLNTAIPDVYSLSQNYPNPFNPTTKINYALPKTGLVTMKIYDVTGREIQTLVNDVKQAGNYTVDFNGVNLSSGVYFYKIQSGDFVSVKRMVLIK